MPALPGQVATGLPAKCRNCHSLQPNRTACALSYSPAATPQGDGFSLSLQPAMEFITKEDYTDNWQSEMNEAFCFWSFAEWQVALREAGFRVLEGSHAYTNEWRVKHRFAGRVALFALVGAPLPWPVTNMVLVGEKA